MNKALAYFGLGLLAISMLAAACSPSPAPEKPTSTPTVGIGELRPTVPALEATATLPPRPTPTNTPVPPTATPEPTPTRLPELSWPVAFNLLDQIHTERTTVKDSTLVVNNLDSEQFQGATGKWIPLDGPFSVGASFDYQSTWSPKDRYATLILLGNPPNSGKEWEGLKCLWLSIRPDVLRLEISDGASENVVQIMSSPIPGLTHGDKFSVIFSDPQGKQFSIVDENGKKLMEIDVTKLSKQLSNGLFPEKQLRAGFILTPRSELTISEFSLRKPSVAEIVNPEDLPALKDLPPASMKVGSSVEVWTEEPLHEARYMESFTRMFNLGVVGNAFEMNILLPNVEGDVNTMSNEQILSQIDWSRADQTIKLLKPTGVKIRGYNVVDETPTDRVPSWLAKMSTERLRQFLPAYVKTMITRYPEISEWAIVLEPLWSDGKGWAGFASNSFWYSRLGKDYFKIAFKAAKEANLKIEAMLVENLSYGNHTNIVLNEEFYALYNLVAELKQNSVPIDHVGLETHLLARDFKTEADINQFKQELIQAMQKLAGLGVKVDITELDVNLAGVPGSEAEQLAWQAKIYRAATEAAVESGVCSSLTFWGFTDAATWIGTPGYPYGEGKAPLLLDANYQPKPALKTVADALKAATGR